MSKSEFAKVIFHLSKDVFSPNVEMECQFEITEHLAANSWDWIGIYPVGWKTQKDYITYNYVSLPAGYEKGKKVFSKVIFDASVLPKDKGPDHYYQICYVSRGLNCVCGASDAIQFSTSTGKEYVEEECEDMMVVRAKTDVMQEEIQKLNHKLLLLTTEREELRGNIAKLEKMMNVRDMIITELQTDMKLLEELQEQSKDQRKELSLQLENCMKMLTVEQQEKKSIEGELSSGSKKVADLESQITTLKAKIRSLHSERDELSGQNQSLIDELDTYKTQVTESQTVVTQSGKTIAKLNESLEVAYNQCANVVEECEELKKRGAEKDELLRQKSEQMMQLAKEKDEAVRKHEDLTFELQNARDMLLASSEVKTRLSCDLEAYELTQQKMTCKFEEQESEVRSLKDQLEHKSKECADLKKQVDAKTKELDEKTETLSQAERTLDYTLRETQQQTLRHECFTKKYEESERGKKEAWRQLELVRAQLQSEAERRLVLQRQVQNLREDMNSNAAAKQKVIDENLRKVKDMTELVKDKDLELERRAALIQNFHKEFAKMREQLSTNSKMLGEKSSALNQAQAQLQEMEHCYKSSRQEVERLQEDKDAMTQKCQEAVEALRELEIEKEEAKEEEAAKYCLWKANETLKSRIEAKDREANNVKQQLAELKKENEDLKEEYKREVEDLKQRLELGKLEFKTKALENQKLARQLKKEVSQKVRRASESAESSSTEVSLSASASDTEGADGESHKKYKQLYKAAKKERETLQAMLEEKDSKLSQVMCEHDSLEEQARDMSEVIQALEERVLEKDALIEELQSQIIEVQDEEEVEAEDVVTDEELEQEQTEPEELEQTEPEEQELEQTEPEEQELEETEELELEETEELELEQTEPEELELEQTEPEELEQEQTEELELEQEQTEPEELIYGNPYSPQVQAAAEPPELQTIIRSTLEEEAESDDSMSAAAEGHQLPPPLEPEVVSTQGAAAGSDVEDAVAEEGGHEVFEDCPAVLSADDSFLDAIGEGMKICPFCQASVLATSDFEEHMATHFGRICPVCRSQADDSMSPQDFEQHVNKCLDMESATAPPQELDGE